jgi:multisubunit Na+/H+ antiporter MnhE subunit
MNILFPQEVVISFSSWVVIAPKFSIREANLSLVVGTGSLEELMDVKRTIKEPVRRRSYSCSLFLAYFHCLRKELAL